MPRKISVYKDPSWVLAYAEAWSARRAEVRGRPIDEVREGLLEHFTASIESYPYAAELVGVDPGTHLAPANEYADTVAARLAKVVLRAEMYAAVVLRVSPSHDRDAQHDRQEWMRRLLASPADYIPESVEFLDPLRRAVGTMQGETPGAVSSRATLTVGPNPQRAELQRLLRARPGRPVDVDDDIATVEVDSSRPAPLWHPVGELDDDALVVEIDELRAAQELPIARIEGSAEKSAQRPYIHPVLLGLLAMEGGLHAIAAIANEPSGQRVCEAALRVFNAGGEDESRLALIPRAGQGVTFGHFQWKKFLASLEAMLDVVHQRAAPEVVEDAFLAWRAQTVSDPLLLPAVQELLNEALPVYGADAEAVFVAAYHHTLERWEQVVGEWAADAKEGSRASRLVRSDHVRRTLQGDSQQSPDLVGYYGTLPNWSVALSEVDQFARPQLRAAGRAERLDELLVAYRERGLGDGQAPVAATGRSDSDVVKAAPKTRLGGVWAKVESGAQHLPRLPFGPAGRARRGAVTEARPSAPPRS